MKSAKERGNKVLFTVIYLAPQDYHRYHSPAIFTASYRRHIAGYLEPVKPAYVYKHKDVFKDNERANVLGEWHHGFFAMSFIGALNVGSICLLFDDTLKTNLKSPKEPYITDRNYQTLGEGDGAFLHYPVLKRKLFGKTSDKEEYVEGVDKLSATKYLSEFDIKDMVDLGKGSPDFLYSPSTENKLEYNILNGFRGENDT